MRRVSRRAVLGGLGGALVGLAGCLDRGPDQDPEPDRDPEPEPEPMPEPGPEDDGPQYEYREEFGTVVNVVEDAGADPSGGESVVGVVEEAAGDDTLLVFPPGEYLVDRMIDLSGLRHFGMMGAGDRGAVTFVVPHRIGEGKPGRHRAVNLERMAEGPVFANIDFDQTATPEAKANTRFYGSDGLEVRDVRIVGSDVVETRDSENHNVSGKLYVGVTHPDGTGLVENFVARGGTKLGVYKQSESGCYVGGTHRGELTLRDCEFEGWSDNGVYASRTRGPVRIEGGVFRNNDIANVRLGHPRSSVHGARIVVDGTDLHGDNDASDFRNPRAIWFESGEFDWSGAGARNCSIVVRGIDHASGAISVSSDSGSFWVEDTTVQVEADGIPALWAGAPTNHAGDRTAGRLERVEMTGSASGSTAAYVRSRPGTTFRNCRIDHPRGDRHGVYLDGSPECTIEGTTVRVGGYPVVVDGSQPSDGCLISVRQVSLDGRLASVNSSDDLPEFDPNGETPQCLEDVELGDESDVVVLADGRISRAVEDEVL